MKANRIVVVSEFIQDAQSYAVKHFGLIQSQARIDGYIYTHSIDANGVPVTPVSRRQIDRFEGCELGLVIVHRTSLDPQDELFLKCRLRGRPIVYSNL